MEDDGWAGDWECDAGCTEEFGAKSKETDCFDEKGVCRCLWWDGWNCEDNDAGETPNERSGGLLGGFGRVRRGVDGGEGQGEDCAGLETTAGGERKWGRKWWEGCGCGWCGWWCEEKRDGCNIEVMRLVKPMGTKKKVSY